MNSFDLRRTTRSDPASVLAAGDPVARGTGPSPAMHFVTQYLSIVRRRKWVILGAILAAILLGLLVTLLMTPRYTAISLLEIQRETRNFTNVEGAEPQQASAVDLEFYETQYGLLRSRSLAIRVATSLRLYDDQRFFDLFGREQAGWFTDGRAQPAARPARIEAAADILLRNVGINPMRLSRLVEVSFSSPDPALSKRIVDAWSSTFIRETLERRFEATSFARRFLEQKLVQLQGRINDSERALVSYAAREGIVNLPSSTPSEGAGAVQGERSLVADDLASINRELSQATADRLRAQSRLGASGGAVTEALDNQAISSLRSKRAELAGDYAKMMVQFEPDYPPARALQNQIDQLDRSIGREEGRVSETLRDTYQASRGREQALAQRVDQLKSGVLDLRRRSIQYNIYQRDADTNRQLYDALLQRYKEIGVAGGVGVNNISVVDAAELPDRPSSPRLFLNLALALMVGMVLGAGAALVLEQIDEAISDPAEVEQLLEVPLLGTSPKVQDASPVEALADVKSPLAEAYLSIQTNLSFATDHGAPRTLAVTSTRPAEGKTTTSYALARLMARSGRRALLVDADMRSPSIHHRLDIPNDAGLSNYLSGSDELDKMIRATAYDNLFVLTAGPQPPSAPELLSGDRFGQLLAELTASFDQIVFDAPPVMGFADAPLIGSRVEGTIFVLESHGTKKSMAKVAIARLRAANAMIVGAVLTKFDTKRAHYGYGYDYGYSYGYGDTAKSRAG